MHVIILFSLIHVINSQTFWQNKELTSYENLRLTSSLPTKASLIQRPRSHQAACRERDRSTPKSSACWMLMHIARIILKCNACLNIAVMHTAAIALQCNIFLRIAQMQISAVHCKAQGGPVLKAGGETQTGQGNILQSRMIIIKNSPENFSLTNTRRAWSPAKQPLDLASLSARGSLSLHCTRTNFDISISCWWIPIKNAPSSQGCVSC